MKYDIKHQNVLPIVFIRQILSDSGNNVPALIILTCLYVYNRMKNDAEHNPL